MLVSGQLIKPITTREKTETRRVAGLKNINQNPDRFSFVRMEYFDSTGLFWAVFLDSETGNDVTIRSPYGGKGDTLWVRENWYAVKGFDDVKPSDLPQNDILMTGYMADGNKPDWAGKTRPSIHLPRWLSRYQLTNQDTYPERLHDITEDSVRREGAGREVRQMWLFGLDAEGRRKVYRDSFRRLWVEINDQDSWDANPWVWVIKFTLNR